MKMLIILFALSYTQIAHSQILNRSFETRVFDEYGFGVPEHWTTNNDSSLHRVSLDSCSVVGERAAVLSPASSSAFLDCRSTLEQGISLSDQTFASSLGFFYKLSPDNPDVQAPYFEVEVLAFSSGELLGWDDFVADDFTENYKNIFLDLNFPESDSLLIRFISGAANGSDDGCYNETIAHVDSTFLIINTISNTQDEDKLNHDINIFPNPAFGYLTLQGDLDEIESYQIYTLDGRLVAQSRDISNSIALEHKGMLILTVTTKDGRITSRKFISQ